MCSLEMFVSSSQLKISKHLFYTACLFPPIWSNWYFHSGIAGNTHGFPATPVPEERKGLPHWQLGNMTEGKKIT